MSYDYFIPGGTLQAHEGSLKNKFVVQNNDVQPKIIIVYLKSTSERSQQIVADSGYKSISRIDQPEKRNHGWYVRVYFRGKMYSKFFNDRHHGGPEAALEEAVQYRNELEKEIGKPRSERFVVRVSPRNQSGMIGVSRRMKKSGHKGRPEGYDVFEVTWSPKPGQIARTSVSIEKYGEEEAFRRACAIRREKEREIYRREAEANR